MFGAIDEQNLVGVVGGGEGLVGDGEVADEGVVVVLGTGGALKDFVVGPVAAELLAVYGQITDESAEGGVVGVTAGVEAEHGGRVGGDGGPVGVQLAGMRVEKDEACLVALRGGQGTEVGDEPAREAVVGKDVEAPAEDESRPAGGLQGVQQVPGAGMDALRPGSTLALGCGGAGDGVQVGAFGVVEAQGGGERVKDFC